MSMSVSMSSRPNCGMERATVAMKMPMEVVANKCSVAPSKNSGTETNTKLVEGPQSISPMKFQKGRSDKPKPAIKAKIDKAAPT